MNINTAFTQKLLSLVMPEVKKVTTVQERKDAWVYKLLGDWEFHGPNGFYWYGQADNAYHARYLGWSKWLESVDPVGWANWTESRKTISTFFERFPDAESARVYLESRLWPNGVICPVCKTGERITGGYYRCNACVEDFTVRTGTIFERSHVPLHKWIYAMYLFVTARKGISSLQLAKEIGITQKSAWFVLHRLREACGKDLTRLRGIVLDAVADVVLAYRPKPKTLPARRRKRRAAKIRLDKEKPQ